MKEKLISSYVCQQLVRYVKEKRDNEFEQALVRVLIGLVLIYYFNDLQFSQAQAVAANALNLVFVPSLFVIAAVSMAACVYFWPGEMPMLAFNYYSASHVHPVCVFGMMYVLEIMASVYGGRAARSLAANLNRNSMEGFSFLDSHADLDQEHVIKLRNLFQSFTDESSQAALLNSIKMNFYLFEKIMDY
jgi:hypothetical protein